MAQATRTGPDGLTLGERMVLTRRRQRLTLAAVAKEAGIDISALSRYERDLRDPPAQTLLRVAKVLGTTPDYLLGLPSDPVTPG